MCGLQREEKKIEERTRGRVDSDVMSPLDLFAGDRKKRKEEKGGWRLREERVGRKLD